MPPAFLSAYFFSAISDSIALTAEVISDPLADIYENASMSSAELEAISSGLSLSLIEFDCCKPSYIAET